jgi:hypothetical protein
MKQWNVAVCRDGRSVVIGQVTEQSETLARCAALSRFGVSDVEIASGEVWSPGSSIYPDEDFDVSPVL